MNLKVKLLALFILTGTFVFGQNNLGIDTLSSQHEKHIVKYRHSIGASLFMVLNLFPDPADYYLLQYGYQLSPKDRVFAEFNTWKYFEPKGHTEIQKICILVLSELLALDLVISAFIGKGCLGLLKQLLL